MNGAESMAMLSPSHHHFSRIVHSVSTALRVLLDQWEVGCAANGLGCYRGDAGDSGEVSVEVNARLATSAEVAECMKLSADCSKGMRSRT